MRKPISAERRERGRRRALSLPLISVALGVVRGGTLVFDPAASAAAIQKALDETRARTQKGPTT